MRRRVLAVGALLLALSAARAAAPDGATGVLAPPEHRRGEEQTFLTFPEWFLVFSPAEYAQFVQRHTPDGFFFWGHIGQFWSGYRAVTAETLARREPVNYGYHAMILVIGVSTTIEYAVRSAYETVVGRLTALTAGRVTAEDAYGARAAQEYVDFIRYRPWYEFDFLARLRGLWFRTDAFGPDLLRKWERRYALTTEYGVKALYGWLIGVGTRSAYETPRQVTTIAVDRWPVCSGSIRAVEVLARGAGGEALLSLPRYEGFGAPLTALAGCDAQVLEIAGNRTVILISTQGPAGAMPFAGSRILMRQPLLTQPGRERTVSIVSVRDLGSSLRALPAGPSVLEHVFDY